MAITNDLWNLIWKQDQHNSYMSFTTLKYANNHRHGNKTLRLSHKCKATDICGSKNCELKGSVSSIIITL